MPQIALPQDVHRFWFADTIDDPQAAKARSDVWFRSSKEFDEQIRQRFAPTISAGAHSELSAWENAAGSCVALVVVLDQFPRNVFRNTAAAFAYDHLALAVTQRGLAAGYLDGLSVVERAFVLMPYQHVEDALLQREGVRLFERMTAKAPAQWRPFAQNTLDFARRHLEIIERFGRFPYRNRVLNRASTPAELEYLEAGPNTFGQGS